MRLGPELKLPRLKSPELKAPTFLVDLWWDLWDRRLLPLVALALVAIAAVPILLSGGSGESTAQTAARRAASAAAVERAASPASTFTVVEENPGLRDYRRRLAHRRPTDPFKQRFTAPAPSAAAQPSQATSTTVPATTTPSSGGGHGAAPASGSPAGEGGSTTPAVRIRRHVTYFTYAINVWISRTHRDGKGGEKSESWARKRVRPYTALPGAKRAVVAYMGPSKKGKPVLLVSNLVTETSGEGRCLVGRKATEGEASKEGVEGVEGETAKACQLLEVRPGFPETFVYGPSGVRYTIKVTKLERITIPPPG